MGASTNRNTGGRKLKVLNIALTVEAFPEHPAMDVAVSHAILEAVASGKQPETFRIHIPSPVVAFGGADRANEGYPYAVRAAEAHGYAPVERLAGGRAAVFHEGTLAFAWTSPSQDPRAGITDRFRAISDIMNRAFRGLGVDARVGEVPGEYCPGQWSINLAGRIKVMGVGQRLVRGASHVGGVVVVSGGDKIRDVLIPVYRSLGFDWDPRTTGALSDMAPGLTTDRTRDAILDQLRRDNDLTPSTIPPSIVERARNLVETHLPRVA